MNLVVANTRTFSTTIGLDKPYTVISANTTDFHQFQSKAFFSFSLLYVLNFGKSLLSKPLHYKMKTPTKFCTVIVSVVITCMMTQKLFEKFRPEHIFYHFYPIPLPTVLEV